MRLLEQKLKRAFDIGASSVGLVALTPLYATVAFCVRKELGSPIIFRQARTGVNGSPFRVYKFRTMTNDTDENGKLLPDEQRMTELGQLLRRTSIDELPSLLNVLKGEMSLVGPRPQMHEFAELLSDEQRERLTVLPGITGWAQVNGRNAISWQKKFELDVWYVRNASFLLDLKILLKTVSVVVSGDGVNKEGHATTDRFTGEN